MPNDTILNTPAPVNETPVATVPDASTQAAPALPEWLAGVEPDIASDPSLKAIQDIPSLAKSYVHAQRMVGKNRAVLPDANTDEQTRREFYVKLGLPADVKDYKVDVKDSVFAEDFQQQFNELAHKHNILPAQAQALVQYMNDAIKQHEEAQEQEQQSLIESQVEELKKEWGEGFTKNVMKAQTVVKLFGDDDLKQYLDESGLGNNTKLIKFLAKIGDSLKEDNFQTEAVGHLGISPSEAQKKIDAIMGDPASAYFNPMHPSHKHTVAEVNKLFSVIAQ